MKNILFILLFCVSSSLFAQKNNPLAPFLRKGASINVASTWHSAQFSNGFGAKGVTFPTTLGYQISLMRYRRPIRRFGIEYGIGIGYHPITAAMELSPSNYPNLTSEVQNITIKTGDYYGQVPLKLNFYHPLSTRFSLTASIGAAIWVYKNGSSGRLITFNEAEKIAVAWYNYDVIVPKILAGVGGQYQWSNHLATRFMVAYDYGTKTSIDGEYRIYTNPVQYGGQFNSKGNATKIEVGLIFTH
jgi:hypothetical protein